MPIPSVFSAYNSSIIRYHHNTHPSHTLPTNQSIHHPPFTGKAALLDRPLDIAVKAHEFLQGLTAAPQPLTKFDHLAVPGKRYSMENWGLMHYDEDRCAVVDLRGASIS